MMRFIPTLTPRGNLDAAQFVGGSRLWRSPTDTTDSDFFGRVPTRPAGGLEHAQGLGMVPQLVAAPFGIPSRFTLEAPTAEHWHALQFFTRAARTCSPGESRIVLDRNAAVTSFPIHGARQEEGLEYVDV